MTEVNTADRVVVSVTATDSGDWQVVSVPTGFQGVVATLFAENDFLHGFVRHEDGEQWEVYDFDGGDDTKLLQVTSITGTVTLARPATPYDSSRSDGARMDAGSGTHTMTLSIGAGTLKRIFREISPFWKTFTSADASPSVSGYRWFKTNGSTAITRFDDLTNGQGFWVRWGGTDIVIQNNGDIVLFGGANQTLSAINPAIYFAVESGVAKQMAGNLAPLDEDDFASDSAIRSASQQSIKAYIASQIVDEDDFASDSATKAPSQQSTKAYIDSVATGLSPKASVKAATTANITLSGTQTIDGIALSVNDRVLVKDQSTAANNGIYTVQSSTWTRATDMNAWAEVPSAYVWVAQGTANSDTGWVCTSNAGGTLGSTAINWIQFGGANYVSPAQQAYVDSEIAATLTSLGGGEALSARVDFGVNVEDFGVRPLGHAEYVSAAYNTAQTEAAIQYGLTKWGRFTLHWGFSTEANPYLYDPSTSTEYFDADGVPVAANTCCIIQREGVTFMGKGKGSTFIKTSSTNASCVYAVSPDTQGVYDISFVGQSGTSGSAHGIIQLVLGDTGLTNLASPGTFASSAEGWLATGTGTISNPSGRMRLTADVGTTTPPRAYHAYSGLTVGKNYRVRAEGYKGSCDFITIASSTSISAGTITEDMKYIQDRSDYMNFEATATTMYVQVYCDTMAAGEYIEIDNLVLVQWDLEDQHSYCKNYTVMNCAFKDLSAYGSAVQTGTVENVKFLFNDYYNTGADGIDVKARGTSGTIAEEFLYGLVIIGCHVTKFGQKSSLDNQAGIDFRGQGFVYGNTVQIVGASIGDSRTGIRSRQGEGTGVDVSPGGAYGRVCGNLVTSDGTENAIGFGMYGHHVICSDNHSFNCDRHVEVQGLLEYATHDVHISNHKAIGGVNAFYMGNNSSRTVLSNCQAYDVTGTVLYFGGIKNKAYNTTVVNCATFVNFAADGNIVDGGSLETITTKKTGAGANCVIRNVDGYHSRINQKSTSFAADATGAGTKSFTHGLDVTPTVEQCSVNYTAPTGGGLAMVTAVDSTTVTTIWRCTTAGTATHVGYVTLKIDTEILIG